jgi:hypothetical protein
MQPSSRTPEGEASQCPICGKEVRLEPSRPPGDAPCPHCGHLLWFAAPSSPAAETMSTIDNTIHLWMNRLGGCPDAVYFEKLILGLATFIAARRGAAWMVADRCLKRVFYHEELEFFETPSERKRGDDLLRRVATTGQWHVSRPTAEAELTSDRPYRNSCPLIATPIKVKGRTVAIIEIAQEPGGTADLQQSVLRFLEVIAHTASRRVGKLAAANLVSDAVLDIEGTTPAGAAGGKKRWWQMWKKWVSRR